MFLNALHGEFSVFVFARTVELVMAYDDSGFWFHYLGEYFSCLESVLQMAAAEGRALSSMADVGSTPSFCHIQNRFWLLMLGFTADM